MPTCKICNKEFSMLTNTHVKKHGLTLQQYRDTYPDAEIISSSLHTRFSENAKKQNSQRDYSNLGSKISATKTERKANGKDYGEHLRGVQKTEEHRLHSSEAAKASYDNGRKHWALGLDMNLDVRAKISASLKIQCAPHVEIRNQLRNDKLKKIAAIKQINAEQNAIAQKASLANRGLEVIKIHEGHCDLQCSCGHLWSLTIQYLDESRRDKIFCRSCTPKLTTSKSELELFEFIKHIVPTAIQGDRLILGGRELDILLPEQKIAFELNGLYWHSELVRGSPKHMLWKQQHAYKLGYQVYHIYEDEWLDKRSIVEDRIMAILGKLPFKADARKLVIIKPNSALKNTFLKASHLQGSDISGISYGLADSSGAMLACMTFKKTSYIKGGDGSGYELSRFATKNGFNVRGAASKLLSIFLKDHKPSKLISYADRRWSFGKLYEALGFKFESFSPPSYWYMQGYKNRTHRASFMKHALVSQGHDPNKTEWEIMQELGYDRIWDCGTLKYSYGITS